MYSCTLNNGFICNINLDLFDLDILFFTLISSGSGSLFKVASMYHALDVLAPDANAHTNMNGSSGFKPYNIFHSYCDIVNIIANCFSTNFSINSKHSQS